MGSSLVPERTPTVSTEVTNAGAMAGTEPENASTAPVPPAASTTAASVEPEPTSASDTPSDPIGVQRVHWIFVTDCSAYMFNQGNMLLASAAAVKQPGAWTWIAYGCGKKDQRKALKKL